MRNSSSSVHRLVDGVLVRGDDELGLQRHLVRVVDAGQARDLADALPGVEALDVALGGHLDRGADVHLQVGGAVGLVRGPDLAADVAERRDRRDEDQDAVAGQQLRDPADPPDVDRPVVAGVAAGGGEVRPDRVAVEDLDPQSAGPQLGLAAVGDGRLARAGQAGEPDRRAALSGQGSRILVGHRDSRRGAETGEQAGGRPRRRDVGPSGGTRPSDRTGRRRGRDGPARTARAASGTRGNPHPVRRARAIGPGTARETCVTCLFTLPLQRW